MSFDLSGYLQELNEEAEEKADELRTRYKLGIRGIKDIFQFIDQTLGYLLIRYPLGENSLQGFAAVHTGERLIVTNSSQRLGREIFTAAHEIGHHEFDIDVENPSIIHDEHIGKFNQDDAIEYRADCFAAHFLMPKEGIKKALKEIGKINSEITYFDVIQLQIEFGVSYNAMVKRLFLLGFIDKAKSDELYGYYPNLGLSLTGLFNRINADTKLIDRSNVVQVPVKYFKYLQSNYENGLISYEVLENVLSKINKRPEELGFVYKNFSSAEKEKNIDEELDDLLGEFEEN
ncbi:ImmA/IrrE family metallo-endopeptidase [Bacillus smithii]|uniref:ImmA/IrrE family metallo-endopeptidase n=1 Tax=Bacillus smithii TaxID=1479 RepID=UPI002E1EAEEA|nr:ImmA/IrrE family metallo-endopeptidase [Bacillus smithii]MED4928766.1 ImmA/IrrE family metallo-endopeptidase [Bacillus smithii]